MTRKIHFVSSHAQLGGSERYLCDLATNIAADWRVSLTCLQEGPFVDRMRSAGVGVSTVPAGNKPISIARAALQLRALLRESRPDVVHANGVKAAAVAVLAGTGVPVVWAKHDFSWDRAAKFVARGCACVVGVSQAVLGPLEAVTRTRVVHPGIEQKALATGDRSAVLAALLPGEGPVIILVGRIHPVKGYRDAIGLLPAIQRGVPPVRLLIVGGDDPAYPTHAGQLRDLAARTGGTVCWAGQRSDAVDLIAASDLLLVTSGSDPEADRGEGFGYTALEAMALGTPVVGYARGGLPEVLGPCGRMVPAGEKRQLKDAVIEVLKDKSLSRDMAACGRERARTSFSLDRFIDEMQQVYSAVTG